MNKFPKASFLIILFYFFSQVAFSQSKERLLSEVLEELEKQYDVHFSYADKTITNVTTSFKIHTNNLKLLLKELEQDTGLHFKMIDDSFVTISQDLGLKQETNSLLKYEKLDEVLISNYLTSGISKNKGAEIKISPPEISILPGLVEPDILQIVTALPGFVNVNEDVSNISVRGGTPDQNVILYDGIKVYQSGHFFGLISAFNPYIYKKIDVYKKGTPARYGDGISSVIHMHLPDSLNSKQTSEIGINFLNADVFSNIRIGEKTQLHLAARHSLTSFLKTPTFKSYFNRVFENSNLNNSETQVVSRNERFHFYDATFKLLHKISDKDQLSFSFLFIKDQLNYDEESLINQQIEATSSFLEQQSIAGAITYKRNWSKKWFLDIQLYYSEYTLKGINNELSTSRRLNQQNNVIENGFKLNTNYKLNNQFRFSTGFQFSEVGVENLDDVNIPRFRRLIKRVLISLSGYAETKYKSPNGQSRASLGLRNNYYQKFNRIFIEPRLYLSQQLLPHLRIEGSVEYKSQSTSQFIDLPNDFFGIEKRRWVLADNNLIPIITSKQFDTGLIYNKNNLIIHLEGYYKAVKNITTRSQGFQNQFQNIDTIGDYNIKGIDFLINKKFKRFSSWLSYSLSENSYTFKTLNNSQSFPSNFDVRQAINFSGTYTINKFKIALGFNWRTGKPFTRPETTQIQSQNTILYNLPPNNSRLPNYLRTDFSTLYSFKIAKHKATIGLALWNIFNRKNILNRYYDISNNEINELDNKGLALTPNLSLRFRF